MIRTLLAVSLAASMAAYGQGDDDAPIPYGDGDDVSGDTVTPKKARKKRRAEEIREEDQEEKEGEESLASVDDPNIGIGGSIIMGVAFLDAAKYGVDPRYYFGLRFTWEFGRLIPDEYLREMFFMDVMWTYAATKEGTAQVNVETHLHNFTVAPAFALPFGSKSVIAAYAQLGLGFNYSQSVTRIDTQTTTLGGTKFLFQYGLGLRGRPAVSADQTVRIEFRIELTRFIRGYLHDMYLGGCFGMIF